jgi:glycosyltransferase involved in cell wall biosynthesis
LSFHMILPNTNQELFEKISSLAEKIPNISLSEKVSRKSIHQYFAKAKYLIITSSGEGFPNVLIEALAQGTPVVSLGIDFDSILSDGTVGYLGDGSIHSISKFIQSTPDSVWLSLSRNARQLALEKFSIENGIHTYESILAQI